MRNVWMAASALIVAGLIVTQAPAKELQFGGHTWQVTGSVSIDTDTAPEGVEGGSLKIEPGGRAELAVNEGNGSGAVEFAVYESGKAIAKPKSRATGPLYGVAAADGRMLALGSIYAPYLSGDKSYALTYANPDASPAEQAYHKVQYLGIQRTEGWHTWRFEFDVNKGVTVKHNGKDVNGRRQRFDWNKTGMLGLNRVVLVGDQSADKNQTIWIAQVKAEGGPAMQVKPTPPPPPPPATPEADPVPDEPVMLVEPVRGKHPRLLFSADEVEAMMQFIQTPLGEKMWAEVLAYLGPSSPPDKPGFLRNATDGQRQGFWRMPTVGLHYVLTGDEKSFDKCLGYMKMLVDLEHWEEGGERDSGMSAANVMIGAALLYDWLYDDLDPEFRARYRDKLLLQARRIYNRGHLGKGGGGGYWISDPQNNHRWHRNAGFALCALAAADPEKTDDDYILGKLKEELAFVAEWLPDDGTSHESPSYMIFGAAHLLLGMTAGDRCFGTDNLQKPFFKNVDRFMNQTLMPGLAGRFSYGDMGDRGTKPIGYGHADHLAVMNQLLDMNGVGVARAWLGVTWYPKALEAGDYTDLPTHDFFPDLGLQFVRSSWQTGDVGAMFKCGPFGGYELNLFRAQNGFRYINIAHDDPDANSFLIVADGKYLTETDRYSKHKQSSNHNTILVNGKGQTVHGRPEGSRWSQPATGKQLMHDIAVVTARAEKGKNLAVEGEAAASYPSNTRRANRPELDRYRRSFIWVDGKYILVLDDIRAPKAVDITWLMQGRQLEATDADAGRYVLKNDDASCPFQVVATQNFAAQIGKSTALDWPQLQLKVNTQAVRLASVYDPWNQKTLTVKLTPDGADHATVTVTGPGVNDTWDWTAGEGRFGPSKIIGKSADGQTILELKEAEPETRKLLKEVDEAVAKARG